MSSQQSLSPDLWQHILIYIKHILMWFKVAGWLVGSSVNLWGAPPYIQTPPPALFFTFNTKVYPHTLFCLGVQPGKQWLFIKDTLFNLEVLIWNCWIYQLFHLFCRSQVLCTWKKRGHLMQVSDSVVLSLQTFILFLSWPFTVNVLSFI